MTMDGPSPYDHDPWAMTTPWPIASRSDAQGLPGTRLITCEADKSIKMWREDPDAVRAPATGYLDTVYYCIP